MPLIDLVRYDAVTTLPFNKDKVWHATARPPRFFCPAGMLDDYNGTDRFWRGHFHL